MKALPFILLLLFLNSGFMDGKESSYTISIIQDGTQHEIGQSDTVHLKRSSFSILTSLSLTEGIYLQASFNPSCYNLDNQSPIPDWQYIEAKAFADAPFNPDKELLLAEDGFNYWFYDPKLNWNRFDPGLEVQNGLVTGTRTIERLWDVDRSEALSLNSINRPIYLFSFLRTVHQDPLKCKAVQRKKAVIMFS
jgi:hypothetical protein